MDNDSLQLHLFENKDIEKYLSTSFVHLNHIITTLQTLSNNACEKEHVVDILNFYHIYPHSTSSLLV